MTFRMRCALVALLVLLTIMLTSFSHPASIRVNLMVFPEVSIQPEPAAVTVPVIHGTAGPLQLTLRSTAYNSLAAQTDSTPFITATGATTEFGIIAVSRDLLGGVLPYGSLVRIRDNGGAGHGRGAGLFQEVLDQQGLFIVEDTMHSRKSQQIDVWFPELSTALTWGVREVEIEVVRHGRDGLILETAEPLLHELPVFASAH